MLARVCLADLHAALTSQRRVKGEADALPTVIARSPSAPDGTRERGGARGELYMGFYFCVFLKACVALLFVFVSLLVVIAVGKLFMHWLRFVRVESGVYIYFFLGRFIVFYIVLNTRKMCYFVNVKKSRYFLFFSHLLAFSVYLKLRIISMMISLVITALSIPSMLFLSTTTTSKYIPSCFY